jgi:hypothetical protein
VDGGAYILGGEMALDERNEGKYRAGSTAGKNNVIISNEVKGAGQC